MLDGANFLLLNIVDHLPELLIGAAFAGQMGLGTTTQHVTYRSSYLLNRLDGRVDSKDFHLLVHLTFGTPVLYLLLVLLLVDRRIGTL